MVRWLVDMQYHLVQGVAQQRRPQGYQNGLPKQWKLRLFQEPTTVTGQFQSPAVVIKKQKSLCEPAKKMLSLSLAIMK